MIVWEVTSEGGSGRPEGLYRERADAEVAALLIAEGMHRDQLRFLRDDPDLYEEEAAFWNADPPPKLELIREPNVTHYGAGFATLDRRAHCYAAVQAVEVK